MRKFLVFMAALFVGMFAFGQSVAFSGNVYTGLRADISNGSGIIYANEDANGTPIWANFRADYFLDSNAGLVLNFRIKGTDVNSKNQSTFYPFLNRGYVWAKSVDGTMRVRSGYLWDSDFESNSNAWDTASNYEWVTEFAFFPVKNVELGVTIPTPYNKMDLVDSIKDTTFGLVFTPSHLRVSVMSEYGHNTANRDVNFGVDFTGITNILMRVEGDLQQIGYDTGYYQLYQEVIYSLGAMTLDMPVTEYFYKDNSASKFNFYPNVTYNVDGITYFGGLHFNFDSNGFDNVYRQVVASGTVPFNAKSNVKIGTYVTMASPLANVVYSPFVQFFAAF